MAGTSATMEGGSATSKPLRYYDDLVEEALASGHYESLPGTNIIQLEASWPGSSGSSKGRSSSSSNNVSMSSTPRQKIQVGSITSLLPHSSDNYEKVFQLTLPIAVYAAIQDFNNRHSVVLDEDSLETLRQCDFYMTLRMRDTGFSASQATREFVDEYFTIPPPSGGNNNNNNNNNSSSHNQVLTSFATLGPLLSPASTAIATLAASTLFPTGQQGVINMSPASGSDVLENRDLYPYFARTHTYSLGKMAALIAYLHSPLQVKHLSILHVSNDYGRGYLESVIRAAQKFDIQVFIASYRDDDLESMQKAIDVLQKIPTTYHLCIPTGGQFQKIILQLYDNDLLGPDNSRGRQWFFSGSVRDIDANVGTIGADDRVADMHRAMHGSVSVATTRSPHAEQIETLMVRFQQDPQQQEDFLQRQVSGIFFNNTQLLEDTMGGEQFPSVSSSGVRGYDGIFALGLAVCQILQEDEPDLSTKNLHHQITKLSFQGGDGRVEFLETASRDPESINYRLVNFDLEVVNNNQTLLHELDKVYLNQHDGVIELVAPIVWSDNTTIQRPPLVPVTQNQNLVSIGLQALCWAIAAAVLLASVVCALWTMARHERPRVRASQPAFLCLFCMGTFIIGAAIIPWTFQEPMSKAVLDMGCMLNMWLLSIGFSTTFASLFARTWRVRSLLSQATSFRRSTVFVRDVMWGPLILIIVNVVLLTLWTALEPLTWKRVVVSVDVFDRVVESYGTCFEMEGKKLSLMFLSLLVVLNILVILVTAVQAYQSRHLPSDYNERFHLAIASFLMLEVMLLGIPLLLFSGTQAPTTLMMVGSWMFAISAFAVLLPMFLPKIGVEEGFVEAEESSSEMTLHQSIRRLRNRSRSLRKSSKNDSLNPAG